jgi:hypothetical protein
VCFCAFCKASSLSMHIQRFHSTLPASEMTLGSSTNLLLFCSDPRQLLCVLKGIVTDACNRRRQAS